MPQNGSNNQMPGNMPQNGSNNQMPGNMPQNGNNNQNQMPGNMPQNGSNSQMPGNMPQDVINSQNPDVISQPTQPNSETEQNADNAAGGENGADNQAGTDMRRNRIPGMDGNNHRGNAPELIGMENAGLNIDEIQKSIDALEDGDEKTNLQTLLDSYKQALENGRSGRRGNRMNPAGNIPETEQEPETETANEEQPAENVIQETEEALKEALNQVSDNG